MLGPGSAPPTRPTCSQSKLRALLPDAELVSDGGRTYEADTAATLALVSRLENAPRERPCRRRCPLSRST